MSNPMITPATHPLQYLQPDPSTNPTRAMRIFLEVAPQQGAIKIDTRHEIDGTPMDVWHGLIRRYPIPALVNAVDLTTAINAGEFDRLLDRIARGHTVEWDGRNWVGKLTQDAEDAELDLAARLEEYEDDSLGGLCDASDWLWSTRHEIGITPTSTDAELQAIASKLEGEALNENVRLYGTLEALEYFRQELIDAQDGEDA